MQKKLNWQLPEKFKLVLAFSLALIVISVFTFGYLWFTQPTFRSWWLNESVFVGTNRINAEKQRQKELQEITQKLVKLNNQNQIYQTIKISELPIYPKAWVERNFNSEEIRNTLISGPEADPDKDGLGNKEEFFYGTNPKNSDTLCNGKIGVQPDIPIECKGLNDKENIEKGISPLTGLDLENPPEITILKQNTSILESLQESFEIASKEQIDFPVLYQLSRKINLNQEFEKIQVIELTNNTQNILDYQQKRLDILKDFVSDESLSALIEIYQITTSEQFNLIRDEYQKRLENLQKIGVPQIYANSHRAYILIFKKIIELIEIRKEAMDKEDLENQTFKQNMQNKATELIWAYRKLINERQLLQRDS